MMEVQEKLLRFNQNLALRRRESVYKKERLRQLGLADFNQPVGLKMNPENRWVKKASIIPWNEIEDRYASLFPSDTGHPAKPLRMALGSLIIQKQYNYSDRELVEQIIENPYYQSSACTRLYLYHSSSSKECNSPYGHPSQHKL